MTRVYPPIQPLTAKRARALAADPTRRRLLEQMASARTLPEIEAAKEAQHRWLMANPDDSGVLEAGEDLAYAEAALLGDELPDGSRAPLAGRGAA